ncbi:hypothetical protein EAJ17_13005 [Akkermansia sp. aa_0143]|nr:hypothetical protein EAJ17_13005 [Akkermansia sp. aa_0143]
MEAGVGKVSCRFLQEKEGRRTSGRKAEKVRSFSGERLVHHDFSAENREENGCRLGCCKGA